MINKSNDLPSFVNETNLPKIVDKLTDAKNIKISNNKYGNRVQTVVDKIVEKADDITKAIKQEVVNNSYSFKVGTGDVDVSADVEDGFGEVGIKGVTYQNLIIPNSMTKPNNVIIDGDIVTLLDSYNTFEGITYKALTKKNTTYTVVLDVKELFKDGIGYKIQINDGAYLYNEPLKPGINVIKIATKENGDNYHIAILKVSTAVGTMKFSKKILLLEGDHTNNPNLPSYFEGIVGVGDKSKNLFNPNLVKQTVLNNLGSLNTTVVEQPHRERCSLRGVKCKPNTTYTIKAESNINISLGSISDAGTSLGETGWKNAKSGIVYTTPNNAKELAMNISKANNRDLLDVEFVNSTNLQLEEGSTATSYEPYYDGHKIEILSNGKNLINLKDMPSGSLENSGKVVMSPTSAYKVTPNFIKIDPTKKICFYYEYNENDASTPEHNMIAYYDKNFSYIGATYDWSTKGIVTTPPTEAHYLRLRVRKEAIKLSLIFESSIVYEPYVSDKTQILLDEPLMRLPNGTHDEITRDGKLIRRGGKIVFDGTENWSPYNINGNTTHFAISIPYIDKFNGGLISHIEHNNNKFMCDKALVTQTRKENLTSICSFYYGPENRYFMFNLPCSSLESAKNWLIENKPILYFPLPTPTIIELPAPYLRIFKDGHLTFTTLVAPESTHVVQLNKSAQIERSFREVQGLDSRVGQLESFYDDMMLETSHKLNLLTYDFEYTKESEDI